ncbi:hypothetical protein EVG20_g11300 [Dentipellis fragilis]|uniref:Uncharacterized protein n=1 Tax=Dentipellis fragilis TaxID=205917 RepID=A0A4Y9XQN0_9AGAM|nr:hypothetical protein EVG20_g11300 [Dentipellis fragilis]
MNPPGRNNFIVTFGIEQEKPWVAIEADLAPTQTCVEFIPTYFTPGTAQSGKREFVSPEVGNRDGAGVNVHAKITSFQGTTFWADLDISN